MHSNADHVANNLSRDMTTNNPHANIWMGTAPNEGSIALPSPVLTTRDG